MAIVKKTEGTVHDDLSSPQQDQSARKSAEASAPRAISLVADVLSANFMKDLSPEGEKYLENLVAACEKNDIGYVVMPSTNSHLFYKNGNVHAIIFAEHVRDAAKVGCDVAIAELSNEFAKSIDTKKVGQLVTTTIVHKTDYERVNNMSKAIQNTLKYAFYPVEYADIVSGKYRINTNLQTVRDELERMSPHGVPARVDFGFVLELADNTSKEVYSGGGAGLFQKYEPKYIPMAAVGGYTDVVRAPGARRLEERFLPLIHISDMQSNIRNIRILPVLLGLALDAFYTNHGWMSPFMSFTKESPNLGSLYFNPESGAPDFLANHDQMRNFCLEMLEDPIMVMDIQPGRMTLPGLDLLISEHQGAVLSDIAEFFNPEHTNIMTIPPLIDRPVQMLTGIVETSGHWIDSRYIDYFTLINSKSDRAFLERFLMYSDRPEDRLSAIEQAGYRSIQPLYTTAVAAINTDGLDMILNLMGTAIDAQIDYAETTQSFSGSSLVARSQRLRDVVSAQGSVIRSGFNRNRGSMFGTTNAWSNRYGNR